MDKINYNQTGGFPLDTDILGAMQTAYSVFNHLGNLAGDKAIIGGCEKLGNSIANGVVFINGEILPFKGGQELANVIIKEESESRVFEDGATKPVIFKKYATFGTSTPDKTFAWTEFKRFDNLIKVAEKNADFETRLQALESKKSPIPIGMIAIWGKPASEPIPEGWKECTDLKGRFPLGWNPDDLDFNQIEKEGGDKAHTLTIEEMPEHNHYTFHNGSGSGWGSNMGRTAISRIGHGGKENYNITGINASANVYSTADTGGNQPHNNMPPYRIIRFIEFVGFN